MMDRVSIKAKMQELSKEIAGHYWDRCRELKIQLQGQLAKTLHVYSQGLRDKQRETTSWWENLEVE